MAVTVSEHRPRESRTELAPKLPRLASFFGALQRFYRSLVTKLILLLFVFLAMPAALYIEFQKADAEKQALLLESLREQGRLIAENLKPLLQQPPQQQPPQPQQPPQQPPSPPQPKPPYPRKQRRASQDQ